MLSALLAVALLLPLDDKPADPAKKDLELLQGTWVMTGLEVNGQSTPEEKLKGATLTIKGNKYTVKTRGMTHEVTFELDATKKPKEIDMHFPDGPEVPKLSKGLYEIDGDTFRMCRAQAAGQDRPREFVTQDIPGVFIVTWKRQR
jgi:uncharacterized protein (TIGR03067 family)